MKTKAKKKATLAIDRRKRTTGTRLTEQYINGYGDRNDPDMSTLARAIDSAVRRAVRETAQAFKYQNMGHGCSAVDAMKRLESRYGVKL